MGTRIMGAGVHMDWGLVGFGCWSARLEEKPSSNLDRKRGIELSCFAKNTLLSSDSSPLRYFFLMPGVIPSDIQGCRLTSRLCLSRTVWYNEGGFISAFSFSRFQSTSTSRQFCAHSISGF